MSIKQIEKVTAAIAFIESHLSEKLDLDAVASAVHYSKYYLHRVFTKTVGLTIHDYVQRRQLTEGAKLLVFSEKPIVEIAAIAGYETQQAFTNIFTAMYKQSPSQYRNNEKFYALQLQFRLKGDYDMLQSKQTITWNIAFALEEDIPVWMELVQLVIDGFPNLQEDEYMDVLKRYIQRKQALIARDGTVAVGIMLFSYQTGSIDFMGTHPLYHKKGLPKAFFDKVISELIKDKDITITTYREGDKADTGHRQMIQELGFAEAELMVEFGYPTQRFVMPKKTAEIPFPDEVAHLADMNKRLDAAVQAANADVEKIDKEYREAKRYMADYRGEIDPHEMFQNELALKQIDRTGAFAVSIWEKLDKLKESPYFARIDFRQDADAVSVKHYIGRFAFTHENELLIFDWRAPIASMFYDCEIGAAGYDAPMGRIEGELTRKRQFKVKNGILEYALESAVNIQDDVLQRELSHTSDDKMKSIIATIQKEQNQIIRNEKTKTMIIQGVAGSGKTSIALHRIAFLLYRFKEQLSAHNVTIISPNKVFGDYIASVLPELGEEPICELSFGELADVQLEGVIAFEPEKDPLETEDEAWAERVRFKSTLDFVRLLQQFAAEAAALVFEPAEYRFNQFSVTADWIQGRFQAYLRHPIKKRLILIADDIHDRFQSDNFMGDNISGSKVILKSLTAMLKIQNTLALYKQFYQWLKRPDLLVQPKKQTLEWSDVFPFLYLHGVYEGLKESKCIKHLVIDEMQDYTPIQYVVINSIFPCPKTILGDFGQFINPNHLHTLSQLQELYSDASFVELNKSYRSTYEIITFAKGIQQVEKLEPMERHGEMPVVIPCTARKDQLNKIEEKLNTFLQSDGVSLGIIVKNNSAAIMLHEQLSQKYEVHFISPDSTRFVNGISITAIRMSKGLEFDEVLVPDVDADTYHTQYDRSLLYIACTRAMHKLALLYAGKVSPLLPDAF